MANLPQSSQSDSMDSLTVTREQFRLAKKDELEYLAQALGNVSGSYTTETINPTAVTLQGTPTLATAAEPAAADSSLRLVNTRWVKQNAASTGTTAPTTPVRGQIWIDTSQDPPVMNVWDDTPPPGAWVPTGGGGASVEIGDTPPAAPDAGDMWWNSDDGRLYIYYKDADSSQWVDASPDSVIEELWSRTGTTISPATAGDSLDMGSFNVDGSAPADSVNLDSSGRLLVGTSSARTNIDYEFGSATAQSQIEGVYAIPGFSIIQNYDSGTQAAPAILVLGRSGATSIGSNTIVANENTVGEIDFSGSDGSSFTRLASIRGVVDGAPGAGNMPGRLTFSTTPSGSTTPVERMRISASGQVRIEGPGDQFFLKQSTGDFGWVQSADQSNGALRIFRHRSGANTEIFRISDNGTINHNPGLASGGVNGYVSSSTTGGTFAFLAQQNSTDTVRLQHDGNCLKPGGGTWNAISDQRAKENIADYSAGLAELLQLEPRTYKYVGSEGEYVGLIAQECEKVMPEMVMTGEGKLPDGTEVDDYRTLNQTPLTFALINAVKELSAQIKTLETKVAALEGGAH